jgi:hypothetical protein
MGNWCSVDGILRQYCGISYWGFTGGRSTEYVALVTVSPIPIFLWPTEVHSLKSPASTSSPFTAVRLSTVQSTFVASPPLLNAASHADRLLHARLSCFISVLKKSVASTKARKVICTALNIWTGEFLFSISNSLEREALNMFRFSIFRLPSAWNAIICSSIVSLWQCSFFSSRIRRIRRRAAHHCIKKKNRRKSPIQQSLIQRNNHPLQKKKWPHTQTRG